MSVFLQEHGMVGMTRLLVMFPLGYLLSRLVIVHLDLFGEVCVGVPSVLWIFVFG